MTQQEQLPSHLADSEPDVESDLVPDDQESDGSGSEAAQETTDSPEQESDPVDPEKTATQVIEVLQAYGTDYEVIKDKLPHGSTLAERSNQVEHLKAHGYIPVVSLPEFYTEGQKRVSNDGQIANEAGYDNKVANEIIERLNKAGYEARIKFSHEDVPFKGYRRFPFICLADSSTDERPIDDRAA